MLVMPRIARIAPGGMLFHVLNRGVGRMRLFRPRGITKRSLVSWRKLLRIAPIRVCAYCWMPNHWHFVLWPEHDGDLSGFMQRMTNMHTQRWQRAKRTRWLRTLVSRAVQIVSDRERRAFLFGRPLRGAKRLQGRIGRACGAMAVGQPAGHGGRWTGTLRLAIATPGRLDRAGQHAADGGGA